MTDAWQYAGEWRHLANTAADRKGSIHDDGAARGLGFKGAFVPGSVVGAAAMPAIIDRFGPAWLRGGWYDFNFVSPVYVDEDVRTVAEPSAEGITCRVETRDGRLCATGRAGLGDSVPWTTEGGPESVFPNAAIGTSFGPLEVEIDADETAKLLEASGDASPCWSEWIPPEQLMPIALRLVDFGKVPIENVRQPGMWAQHAIVVGEPICFGTRYAMVERLAEKGASGRTRYLSFEFEVTNPDGIVVAVGRHKCKFLNA
jgi:hypothetical protein